MLEQHWKKIDPYPGNENFFKIYWIFLTKQNYFEFFSSFRLLFAKTWWIFKRTGNFYNLAFSTVEIWVRQLKNLLFLVDILPLAHFLVDLAPGGQNLAADPTEPDPKHCWEPTVDIEFKQKFKNSKTKDLSHTNIFQSLYLRPLIFRTMNSVRSNNLNLKYKNFTQFKN